MVAQKPYPPQDWVLKKLADISPLQRGFDLPTKQIVKGEYPIVYSNGILNYHNTFQAKAPGVVTGRSGTIGKVTYVEQNYWPHNTSLWVTDFKGNDPRFIYYLYSFLRLERFSTGSGVPTLNRNDVHAFEVLIPKYRKEESAIAKALSDADALIDSLDRLIEKKKNIKQGAMQELLTGKRRLPGFRNEWSVIKLGKLAEMASGGTPLSSKKSYYGGQIPWVVIADMTKANKCLYETEKRITEEGLHNSSAKLYKSGTLLFAMYASIGKCAIAKIDLTFNQAILGIVTKGIDTEYLFYYLAFNEKNFCRMGQTGTQNNLNKEIVQNLEISFPSSKEEQIAIAQVLSDMDLEIEALERKRGKCKLLKVGLMQQLLTGRVRLK